MRGVFHENQAGNPVLDGAFVDLAHLGRREYLHDFFSSINSSRRRSCTGGPMAIKWSPASISASAGGLKIMLPPAFRMASTMTPSSVRSCAWRSDFDTYSQR